MSSSSAACHNINFGPGLVCTEVIYHINTTITTWSLSTQTASLPSWASWQRPCLVTLNGQSTVWLRKRTTTASSLYCCSIAAVLQSHTVRMKSVIFSLNWQSTVWLRKRKTTASSLHCCSDVFLQCCSIAAVLLSHYVHCMAICHQFLISVHSNSIHLRVYISTYVLCTCIWSIDLTRF